MERGDEDGASSVREPPRVTSTDTGQAYLREADIVGEMRDYTHSKSIGNDSVYDF